MSEEAAVESAPEESVESEEIIEGEVLEEGGEATETAPETKEEIEEAIDEALEEGDVTKARELFAELDLVVNGKTVKKTFTSKEDLIRELQIAEANKGGMEQSKNYEKMMANLGQSLKSDAWGTLQQMGLDTDSLFNSRLEEVLRQDSMSEEDIKYEKQEKELENYRKKQQESEDRNKQLESQREIEEMEAEFAEEVESAFSGLDIPFDEDMLIRTADIIIDAKENRKLDIPVDKAAKMAAAEVKGKFKDLVGKIPRELLINEILGKEFMEEERKARLAKMKKQPKRVKTKETVASAKKAKADDKPKQKVSDFFKNLQG